MFPAGVSINHMQVILPSILSLELLLMLNNTSDDIKFCLEYTVNC